MSDEGPEEVLRDVIGESEFNVSDFEFETRKTPFGRQETKATVSEGPVIILKEGEGKDIAEELIRRFRSHVKEEGLYDKLAGTDFLRKGLNPYE